MRERPSLKAGGSMIEDDRPGLFSSAKAAT
jgi:hypothetical protein